MSDLYKQLAEPFPQEKLGYNTNRKLTYVPVAEVISRMNDVLGVGGWQMEVMKTWREHDAMDWVLAHVRVTAWIEGVAVVREGFGGQKVKRTSQGKEPVDLGDEFKGAVSDAFKKACQGFGVGLHLARSEEAVMMDLDEDADKPVTKSTTAAAPKSAPAAKPAAPAKPAASTPQVWINLKEMLDNLAPEKKIRLRNWWSDTYPNEAAPSPSTNPELLENAVHQIVLMEFDATPVND